MKCCVPFCWRRGILATKRSKFLVLVAVLALIVTPWKFTPKLIGLLSSNSDTVSAEAVAAVERREPRTKSNVRPNTSSDNLQYQNYTRSYIMRTHNRCENIQKFGRVFKDGAYDVCLDPSYRPQENHCLIYSFGSKNEFSFEDALHDTFRCEIHTFDPSTNTPESERRPGVFFHPIGLDGQDRNVMVRGVTWVMMTLPSIVTWLHHQDRIIDILKIDIEGCEWSTMSSILRTHTHLQVKQLLVEFHTNRPRGQLVNVTDLDFMLSSLESLESAGFTMFSSHDDNNCCKRFSTWTIAMGGSIRKCCYETMYINKRYSDKSTNVI